MTLLVGAAVKTVLCATACAPCHLQPRHAQARAHDTLVPTASVAATTTGGAPAWPPCRAARLATHNRQTITTESQDSPESDPPPHQRIDAVLGQRSHEAWLHCDMPRIASGSCGKTTRAPVPRARPGSGFTAAFEALALAPCRAMPLRQAANLLRCADKQLLRRIAFNAGQARALESYAGVQTVGIDESSLRRGQHYITVVHDLDAERLLFATEGRDHQTVIDFASNLNAHGGDPGEVRQVCMDMSAANAKGATLALPQAQISYERFHVIAKANEATDLVRRAEMRFAMNQVRQ